MCDELPAVDGRHLRPWRAGDAAILAAGWADPAVARWNPVPPDTSVSFARSWIEGTASQNEASTGVDVVMVDEGGSVLGEVGLQIDPSQAIGEVGFWLVEEARGRGLGSTLLALASLLAARLELVGLVAMTEPANSAAIGLLERCGWVEVPTRSARRAFAIRVDT